MAAANKLQRESEAVSAEADTALRLREEREAAARALEDEADAARRAAASRVCATLGQSAADELARLDASTLGLRAEVAKLDAQLITALAEADAASSAVEEARRSAGAEIAAAADEAAALEATAARLTAEAAVLSAAGLAAGASAAATTAAAEAAADAAEADLRARIAANENARRLLSELAAGRCGCDAAAPGSETSARAKYALLLRRDEEMAAFMAALPAARATVACALRDAADAAAAAHRDISAVSTDVGSKQAASFATLEGDRANGVETTAGSSTGAGGGMSAAPGTSAACSAASADAPAGAVDELTARRAELAKLTALRPKLESEITSLRAREAAAVAALPVLNDVAGLRRASAASAADTEAALPEALRRLEAARAEAAAATAEAAAARAALAAEPQAAALEAVEARLRAAERVAHALREAAATRARETDYSAARADAMTLVSRLNAALLARAAAQPLLSAAAAEAIRWS